MGFSDVQDAIDAIGRLGMAVVVDDEDREMLSCKFLVSSGLEVVDLSDELKMCLARLLPAKRRAPRAK